MPLGLAVSFLLTAVLASCVLTQSPSAPTEPTFDVVSVKRNVSNALGSDVTSVPTQVYDLVLTRKDGRLGPNIKRSEGDCEAKAAAARAIVEKTGWTESG